MYFPEHLTQIVNKSMHIKAKSIVFVECCKENAHNVVLSTLLIAAH